MALIMFVRVWHWLEDSDFRPVIIAHGSGATMVEALAGCGVPVRDPAWKRRTHSSGDVYLIRGRAGFCGQQVTGEDPFGLRKPDERFFSCKTPNKGRKRRKTGGG